MNIKFENINKSYKKNIILENINIELETGKIYALVGKQGTGKSTFLKMISRKVIPTSGVILYDNETKVNEYISVVHRDILFELQSTVKSKLNNASVIYPNFDIEYANYLVNEFKIEGKMYGPLASSGTNSAIDIVIALASNEKVVILDESIVGLDIFNRNIFYKELLEKYNKDNQTFIIASSIIDELQPLINSFILLKDKTIDLFEDISYLDKLVVISGNKDIVDQYCNNEYKHLRDLGNFKEILIEGKEEDFQNLEVRKATLLDLVESYGV